MLLRNTQNLFRRIRGNLAGPTESLVGVTWHQSAMRSWASLSTKAQAARLKKLALEAMEQYGVETEGVSLIAHMNNATFRIEERNSASGTGGRYVLRVNRPGFQDTSAIQAELAWLQALRRDKDLIVPEPVRTLNGKLVVSAAHDGVPQARDCVLFRWIKGRFFGSSASATSFKRAGELLGRIHRHGHSWQPPSSFTRKVIDHDLIMGGQSGVDPGRIRSILSVRDLDTLDHATAAVRETMADMGTGPDVFGLIHGDYHLRHFLLTRHGVAVIDFDECAWGLFAYDIAVALSGIAGNHKYPAQRDAFPEGYRAVWQFPREHKRHLAVLVVARLLLQAVSMAGIVDHPGFRSHAPRMTREFLCEVRQILAGDHAIVSDQQTG